ncbi:MAG TPA: helix-turn-helix domain-containing protein [Terracidiphilus sp.]|nr:helix-turn-helix domain-containing protein [Terracidiphilus sp.]
MIPEKDMHDLKSLSRAVRGGTLDPERLAAKAYEMGSTACHQAITSSPEPETLNLAELEKRALLKAIEATGTIKAAAKLLGIGKTSAYRKIRDYGLTVKTSQAVCPNCGQALRHFPPLTTAAIQ